ncbi:MAG: GspE/PulE family protein [Acidimicrobiales bacterium]
MVGHPKQGWLLRSLHLPPENRHATISDVEPDLVRTRPRLGDLLIGENRVSEEQLQEALAEQRRTGERLGRLLVASGRITEAQLLGVLGRHLGLESIDLDELVPDVGASRLLRESFARRHMALPIGWDGDRLVVAMANPADVFALDDVRSMTGSTIKVVLADPTQLQRALDVVWSFKAEDSMRLAHDNAQEQKVDGAEPVGREEAEGPVIQFVNELLTRAVAERASDVHFEPGERELRIRFRVDGVLHDVMSVPNSIRTSVVSRIKIMGDLDIAERRLPQDGRITLSLPIGHGAPGARCWSPGVGSGKTTSLYAALTELHSPDRNIVTVEDPVEYNMPGIKQVQLNRKAGLTFASALRASCGPIPTASAAPGAPGRATWAGSPSTRSCRSPRSWPTSCSPAPPRKPCGPAPWGRA